MLRETYTLDGSRKRAENDEIVELERLLPPVGELATKDDLVLLIELRKGLEDGRVLGDEGTLLELLLEVT